jgi:hypothetical protein
MFQRATIARSSAANGRARASATEQTLVLKPEAIISPALALLGLAGSPKPSAIAPGPAIVHDFEKRTLCAMARHVQERMPGEHDALPNLEF